MATITVPDFRFSGHYYAELLEDLIQFLRTNTPELTDEDPTSTHIQLARAYALVGHLNNVLLDVVAKEMFLPTAKLRDSVAALLKLIDFRLAQASPAQSELVATLTKVFTSAASLVATGALFATREAPNSPSILYELLEDISTIRTDLVDKVYAFDASINGWTDHSAEAQSPAGSFTPGWGGAPAAGDIIYIGHRSVLWDQLNIFIATPASGITNGVWEYYDGHFDAGVPTSVTNLGATLEFDLTAVLGTANRAGSTVRIRSNITGAYQDVVSTFSGVNKAVTGFLGQTSPSTIATDYIAGSDWRELPGLTDGTSLLTAAAGEHTVVYTLPQTVTLDWSKLTVLHSSEPLGFQQEGYWLRFRVITVSAPSNPAINEIQIHRRKQYVVLQVSQGQSRDDNPLASSTGLSNQEYELTRAPVLDDDNLRVFVVESSVEQEYFKRDNLLNSTGSDRHFTVEFDADGVATISFGDGVNGKIPPVGVNNIRAEYRTMDVVDGNVGSDTIVVNRSGAAFLTNIRNPRQASGFRENEGNTDEDLARVKIAGPASLRTLGRAVGPMDVVQLCESFESSDGSRPVARALPIEESFGPKTIEAVVVGTGGGSITSETIDEMELYFNGDGTEENPGVVVMNNEVTVTNFTPKTINVTATVEGGSLESIETALTALLNPVAQRDDGTHIWDFGTEVPRSKLIQAIMNTDPAPRDVTITVPAADVPLATRELPVVGTLTITVLP